MTFQIGNAVEDISGNKGWVLELFSHRGQQKACVAFKEPFMIAHRVRRLANLKPTDPRSIDMIARS